MENNRNATIAQLAPFVVTADIEYLDGTLEGITIPDGQRTTWGTRDAAMRHVAWIERVRSDNDFVRAAGTGSRFVFRSPATLSVLSAD